ncbi:NAD(+) synthase [Lachnospiraceae bacterium 50-23]
MMIGAEVTRIENFIKDYVRDNEIVVILVSGGLDSDVTARLCCRALGKERIKLCMVIQTEMEDKFRKQASILAEDLEVKLAEIHLEDMNRTLIGALEQAEESGLFRLNTLLDPAKAKCSLRSAVISCYQDKGFLIAGTMNKTEKMLGFFLTFGDNLANFKPLAHLYKTQIMELGRELGTREEVICQESSAGFWEGQTDSEDLAYWIINQGPILAPREFTRDEIKYAEKITPMLTADAVDNILKMCGAGENAENAALKTGSDIGIVKGIYSIVEKVPIYKTRQILLELEGD